MALSAQSSILDIPTARVFLPLLEPSRYKAAWGGRGSGKSFFFADALIEDSLRFPGLRSVCIREVQKDLKDSAKKLIEDRLKVHRLGSLQGFNVYRDRIETPGDGQIIFVGMQDHNSESIKSLENFSRAWVEEAQTLSANSLKLLRPTIRAKGSELWFSWNPRRKVDPVDEMFRQGTPPTDSLIVKANWNDNPWFGETAMPQERLDCLNNEPEEYDHIWEGGYVGVAKGAYYGKQLATAKLEHRIGRVAIDALLPLQAICDIGGTGAKSDAFVMWIRQCVGQEIRWVNYYEKNGQEFADHVHWLRENDLGPDRCKIILPHDGKTNDKVHRVSYQSAFEDAGYTVDVVPNQGTGAAMLRVHAGRRKFPQMYFDGEKCADGIEALKWYHPKLHSVTGADLGPDHDWASHAADAFGLGAVEHKVAAARGPDIVYSGWG